MATKSILINFAGYSNEPFNFMPDNGMANLAACLIKKGHKTVIWDCSTVDLVNEYYPHIYRDEITYMTNIILDKAKNKTTLTEKELGYYNDLNNKLNIFYDAKITDIGNKISDYIKNDRIDFIGMKLWTGEGFAGSIVIAKLLREKNPRIPIFAGGPHVDWFMERIFSITDVFDILAYGEGEETITLLAEYVEDIKSLRDISNIIFKKNNKIIVNPLKRISNLNEIPNPVYDDDVYLAMKDDKKVKIILIDESRGCPNSCNFCIHPLKSGKKRRVMSYKRVVDIIEDTMKKHKINAFRFAGSNPPTHLLTEIAQEIIKRGLNIKYSSFAHVGNISPNYFKLLKKSGCCALAFGVESGSQIILDKSLNKKSSINKIKETLKMCKDSGIKVIASLIIPAPMETEKTKQETFELIREISPDSTVVFFPTMILKTEWDKNQEKYGFKINDPDELYRTAMTYKINHLMPSLSLGLTGYILDGKTFKDIVNETSDFINRLKENKLSTQLFDQIFLLSEFTDMSAEIFGKITHECIITGNYSKIKEIISNINKTITLNNN